MRWIALSTLRGRKSGMVGAFAAVTLAVVLVASCVVLLESSVRAPLPVDRLRAAAVVVHGESTLPPQDGRGNVSVQLSERARLSERLAGRLKAVAGVRAAIADRTFAAEILDGKGRLLTGMDRAPSSGHGWSSAALTPVSLKSGVSPRRPGDVVLDASLADRGSVHIGDRVAVNTVTGRESFTVVGIAGRGAGRESAAYFRDNVAARLSGTGDLVDLIGILPEPGADPERVATRIRAAVSAPGVRVVTGGKRGEAESLEAAISHEDVVAGLTVFASLAAFVAVFVVASTFAISVQQRHRELALLRAIGSTPRQVRRMVAAEALVIAVLAVIVGAPLSILFALAEQPLFVSVHMLPSGLHLVVSWLPFAAGLLTALATTQLAAYASARRASRIRPVDALREAAVQRRPVSWLRGLVGLGALAGGVGLITTFAGRGAGGGEDAPAIVFVLMVAVALLAPLLALPFVWLLGAPLAAFSRGTGLLARANSRANVRRVASVATPLMLTVALTSTMLFARTTLERQTSAQATRSITAEHVLVPTHSAAGLTADVAAAARRLPGVAEASETYATSVVVAADGANLRVFPARAVDPVTLTGAVDLGVTSGSLADLDATSIAVGDARAKEFGWRVGDRVKVWLGDGRRAMLRVAATYKRPLGFGDIVLSRQLARTHVTNALDDAVFVKSDPGSDRISLGAALGKLAHKHPSVDVLTRSHYLSGLGAAALQQSRVIYLLLGIVGLFSLLAVVNAVTMAIAERGRELALIRLVGATSRQVTRMVRAEALIVALFGMTVGSLAAAPGLVVYSRSLTGDSMPAVPLWMVGGLLGGCLAVALLATVLPTRLALRANPVVATGARE